MYLIDTSVWIDSLRQIDNAPSQLFKSLIADRAPYGITGVIYQEVLQGARGQEDFEQLRTPNSLCPSHSSLPFCP